MPLWDHTRRMPVHMKLYSIQRSCRQWMRMLKLSWSLGLVAWRALCDWEAPTRRLRQGGTRTQTRLEHRRAPHAVSSVAVAPGQPPSSLASPRWLGGLCPQWRLPGAPVAGREPEPAMVSRCVERQDFPTRSWIGPGKAGLRLCYYLVVSCFARSSRVSPILGPGSSRASGPVPARAGRTH